MQSDRELMVRFSEFIDGLEHRSDMWTIDYNYAAAINFLFGFMSAEDLYHNNRILDGFQEFVSMKLEKKGCQMHWAFMIREFLAHDDDEEALRVLFPLLREYIAARLATIP